MLDRLRKNFRVCENRDRPGSWPGRRSVVLKDGSKIQYFGGKTQAVEKNTRVKARVKAHALKEFMNTKEKVVVMGHRLPDADSFGAAIGIYRAAKTLNKKSVHRHRQPDQLDHSADEYVQRQPGL